MPPDVERLTLSDTATARDAMQCIDANGPNGIALVVDENRRLLGTITDGDIRRAMLASLDLDVPVRVLIERQQQLNEGRPVPLTAPLGTTNVELVALMERYDVRQIPLVDSDSRVAGIGLWNELVMTDGPPLRAVVMAGGFGKRLGELTQETPKPMLPVGDRPLLERIVGQLRDAGIKHVNLTTHFRADAIASHFGDGRDFGVEIDYVSEDRPLGTAGALGLLEGDGPILVVNGDILTDIDFRAMHRFHDEHGAMMTVAVRPFEITVPYGVIELEGEGVRGIREKPLVQGFVNAGMYLLEREATQYVPAGEPCDMPDLIKRLIDSNHSVVGFPLREYWLDIGHVTDYEQALNDVERLA